ncbi:UNVERIFIED_CONTAM: hypothetical protein FKN15_032023 [Acipenser sinensis]
MASTATSPLKIPKVSLKAKNRDFKGFVGGNVASSQIATGHAVSRHADSSQTDSFSRGSPGSGKAGSSLLWGSGHSTSCSARAAVGAGLLTSPTISGSETAAGVGGLQTSSPFFKAGSSPWWGSGHSTSSSESAAVGAGLLTSPMISGSETAAGVGGLQTSSPFFVAGSSPWWGYGHSTSCCDAEQQAAPGDAEQASLGSAKQGKSSPSHDGECGTSRYSPSAGGGGRSKQSSHGG